jgi:hypothetical protein
LFIILIIMPLNSLCGLCSSLSILFITVGLLTFHGVMLSCFFYTLCFWVEIYASKAKFVDRTIS